MPFNFMPKSVIINRSILQMTDEIRGSNSWVKPLRPLTKGTADPAEWNWRENARRNEGNDDKKKTIGILPYAGCEYDAGRVRGNWRQVAAGREKARDD